MALRYPQKFTSADGSLEVVFPTAQLEYEQEQDLFTSFIEMTGADYEYDMLGTGAAAKKNGIERIRFLVVGEQAEVDAKVEEIRENCYLIGRGKLWQAASSGSRWAWARLDSMPSVRLTVENLNHQPMFLTFQRMSNWTASGVASGV